MGPLVPEIIGNELNYVVAIFIGIAFGYILEQAGFSSSKKLVGLFYGYDFTVLRVFFTAGITAMMGVVILGHFGLLDVSLIYINPTFLWSAIVGGVIMGLGFVIGGFCPGTSICAAAIGKIDAIVFVAGSFLGVFAFAEGYPVFEDLYKASNWGNVRIFDTLGIPQAVFAFLLVAVAIGAFWMVTMIENKVNKKPLMEIESKKLYLVLTSVALLVGLTAFIMPDRKAALIVEAAELTMSETAGYETMETDELAFRLMDLDKKIQIIDFRNKKDFDLLSLPNSVNFTFESLFEQQADKVLSLRERVNVFVAEDEIEARKGAYIAGELGYKNIVILKGGFNNFKKEILEFTLPGEPKNKQQEDLYRFRTAALKELPLLIQAEKQKNAGSVKKTTKRILGGC